MADRRTSVTLLLSVPAGVEFVTESITAFAERLRKQVGKAAS